jgi:CHC2-type zinc finger protein
MIDYSEIRRRIPLAGFVKSCGIHLQAEHGDHYRAKCPFHNETHGASLIIYPDEHWYCHGKCKAGGNVLDFAAGIWHIEPKAVAAKLLGEELPELERIEPRQVEPNNYLSRWPKPDLVRIREIVAGGWSLYDLWERSPIRFESGDSHAEEIIDLLFPGNPFLCCGKTNYKFATRRRATWCGRLRSLPLIVPNPMLSEIGRTQTGKVSEHTKESTARRTYLTIEFDFGVYGRDGETETEWAPLVREWRAAGITVVDACACLHLHLAERLPLLLAVHSGGKSLHGWYPAFNFTDLELRLFMEYAVQLGADHATWCRSQFVRLPDGTRENGKPQTSYYFDPRKAVR